jgi:hypothetical protein
MSDAVRELLVQYHALSPEEREEFEVQLPESEWKIDQELKEIQENPAFQKMLGERLDSASNPANLRDGPTVMAEALQWLKGRQQ